MLNDKMVLMSAAQEVARICAVEGGKTQNALNRLREPLAGVQERDWDLLVVGHVAVRADDAERISAEIARENLNSVQSLILELRVGAKAENPPAQSDPAVTVSAAYTVRTPFLGSVLGLGRGFQGHVLAEASVVKRTK